MHISLDTDKDCDFVQDRPVLSTGRTPHDEQKRSWLDYNQNLAMSPRWGSTPRWTDGLTVRCKVTLTLRRCQCDVWCSDADYKISVKHRLQLRAKKQSEKSYLYIVT